MSRILFALLCCIGINAHAMVLAPDQSSEATSNKHATHAVHAKSVAKASAIQVIKPVSLPPPSKASLGFYVAAANANYDMMDVYLQQGANINCLNCDRDYQMTALYRAAAENSFSFGNHQLADWLIQRGADINIPANFGGQENGMTLVMRAVSYASYPDYVALDYLVKHGADVKAADSMGRTALHRVNAWNGIDDAYDVGKRFIASIDLLVKNGIDVNRQDKSGMTALMNATNYCSPGAVKLLISYGANTTLKDKLGKSALDFAMDRATQSGQNSPCNEVAKILSKSPQAFRATSSPTYASTNQSQQSVAVYADTYAGTFSGSDSGVFQATISQDGTAYLNGRSQQNQQTFTGEGKVSSDGTITMGNVNTGSTFTGSINSSGALTGTWKNTAYNLSGSFQGQKGTTNAAASANPLDAIGNVLGVLNSIFKP